MNIVAEINGLLKPCLHLDGTPRLALLGNLNGALHALHDAMVAMRKVAPEGRDYHSLGRGALELAIAQHDSRIDRLRMVQLELATMATAIIMSKEVAR